MRQTDCTRLSSAGPVAQGGRGGIPIRGEECGEGGLAVSDHAAADEQRDEFAPFQLFDISSRPARRWQDAFSRIKLHGSAARLGSE